MRAIVLCRQTFLLILILSIFSKVHAQDSSKLTTYIYSIKEKDTLKLDYYTDPQADTANRPCLIYVFGGGFITGKRNDKYSVPFFKKMVKNGFNVVSIDYRLGFRKAFGDPHQKETFKENLKKYKPLQFIDIFYGSINMAVEDLYDATSYIVSHAKDLKINTHKIVATGSSAGAITVLQGQNYIVNKNELCQHLPDNFNYAGVISMAGAIFSMKGDVKWNTNPAPILMFHGDADKQVPYDKVRIKVLLFPLKYGFYGSKHITPQLKKSKSPFWFYSVENAGHEMNYKPMEENIPEIMTFYHTYVDQQKQLEMYTDRKDFSQTDVKKKFGFADYLKGNFGGN